MNDIPQKQNSSLQIQQLKAQRQVYSVAKTILSAQIVINAPMAVVCSVLVLINPRLDSFAASWGISMTLLDILLLTPIQKKLTEYAAQIQELFDSEVLDLRWSSLKVDRKPIHEDIYKWAKRYDKSHPNDQSLKDWYPVRAGEVNLELARLICQRSNCHWDSKLKKRYAWFILTVVIVLFVFSTAIATISGLTLEKFFLIVLGPMMPVISLGLRLSSECRDSAKSSERLMRFTEDLWSQALQGEAAEIVAERSRELQDEVYDRRVNGPLIFNRIYDFFKKRDEEQMRVGADVLVEQVLNRRT